MHQLLDRWSNLSLKVKLTTLFVLVGILPVAVAGYLSTRLSTSSLESQANSRLSDVAYNGLDKLDRNLFERYGDVQAFANSDAARAMDATRLTDFMGTMTGIYTPIYKLMVVADRNGKIIAANPVGPDGNEIASAKIVGSNVAGEEWFQKAIGGQLKDGETFVQDLHEDSLMGTVFGLGREALAMNFTYPIKDTSGNIVGVWSNRFNWEVTETVITEVTDRAHAAGATTVSLTLVNKDGTVLAGGRPEDTLATDVSSHPAVTAALDPKSSGALQGESLDGEGTPSILGFYHSTGYSLYPGIDWSIVAAQDKSEALSDAAHIRTWVIAIALISAVAVFVCGYLFASSISRGVREILSRLRSIADETAPALAHGIRAVEAGDLTVDVRSSTQPIAKYGGDEVGQAAQAINMTLIRIDETIDSYGSMRAGLVELVGGVQRGSSAILSASDQLRTASDQMAQASTQIAGAIGEVAQAATAVSHSAQDTVSEIVRLNEGAGDLSAAAQGNATAAAASKSEASEMGVRISTVASASGDVARSADDSRRAALNGQQAVQEAVTAMGAIADAVGRASNTVQELGAVGQQIGDIVKTIDEIASQTNLLALNAAIEAARAGEQGRGFAVVAENVRTLAERSSLATGEIAELINRVQAGTMDAVSAMDAGVADVERGRDITREAGAALESIIATVRQSAEQMQTIAQDIQGLASGAARIVTSAEGIAASAQDSAIGAGDMARTTSRVQSAVQQVSASSEQTAASVQEVSAATEQLSAQSEELAATATEMRSLAHGLNSAASRFRLA